MQKYDSGRIKNKKTNNEKNSSIYLFNVNNLF